MANRRGIGPGVSFFAFQDIITAVVGIFILITLILVLELAQRVEAASSAEAPGTAALIETVANLESEVERLRKEYQRRSATVASSGQLNAFNRKELLEQSRAEKKASADRLSQVEKQLQRIRDELMNAERESDRLLAEAADLANQRNEIGDTAEKTRKMRRRVDLLTVNESMMYRDRTESGRFLTLIILSDAQIELRDALSRSVRTMRGGRLLEQIRQWLENVDLQRRQLFVLVEPGGASDFDALKKALDDSRAVYGFSVVQADHGIQLGFELEDLP